MLESVLGICKGCCCHHHEFGRGYFWRRRSRPNYSAKDPSYDRIGAELAQLSDDPGNKVKPIQVQEMQGSIVGHELEQPHIISELSDSEGVGGSRH
jgi:hypothetical protein